MSSKCFALLGGALLGLCYAVLESGKGIADTGLLFHRLLDLPVFPGKGVFGFQGCCRDLRGQLFFWDFPFSFSYLLLSPFRKDKEKVACYQEGNKKDGQEEEIDRKEGEVIGLWC